LALNQWPWVLMALIATASAAEHSGIAPTEPLWAFPPPEQSTAADSKLKLSEVRIYDRTRAVDWFPDQHPAMPPSVGGRAPVYACGFCHLPTGGGRPENAALAGLSATYIKQQLAEMQSGKRAYNPRFTTGVNMALTAGASSDADIAAAAEYFASLTYRKRVKVVEAVDIPRPRANSVYFFDRSGAREPLGQRIIEGPDDAHAFELRDPNTTYTAYVPAGSVARGAALAKGERGIPACETCHGPGLKGSSIGPPLAGHFPTGLFRQLYDFKTGYRNGAQGVLMNPVVATLDENDMIALAAYAASLDP
jgi:cytochrome c553